MNRKRRIKTIRVLGPGVNQVEVDLYYNKGGWNYFTGAEERRGLYISVTPVLRSDRTRTYTAFSGVKVHVRTMKRYSQRALDNFEVNDNMTRDLIDRVMKNNNLKYMENEQQG